MPGSIQKILVTGGAGFIGSHIVDELVRRNYSVGVLDNLATGNSDNLAEHLSAKKIAFHEGDISDYEFVTKVVRGYDAVMHQAALVSVTRSVENPQLTNSVNVDGTINLLKAAVDHNVQKFVYASSSSVYGDTKTLPKTEKMITSPVSPYGVSKLAAENYCRTFAKVYGLNTVSLRYFNVYGPRQKYGPYSGVIPTFIKQVLNGNAPLIFGDGEQTRDFTFVADVVQANLSCLERSVNPGEAYNIARGEIITINELGRLIIEILDATGKVDLVHGPQRAGDIRASYADISKARKDLGFAPAFDVESGLRSVIEWFVKGGSKDF